MALSKCCPHIKLEGTPASIGFQHGRKLRERVQNNFTFYKHRLFTAPGIDIEALGREYLKIIDHTFPQYHQEITALAEGAEMQPWQIGALNARTELHLKSFRYNECTSLYDRASCTLGQNWDWLEECESLMVLLEIRPKNGPAIMMLAEPGIIGKIGFNTNGVGVCLNIIHGEGFAMGIPIHILLRAVLDAASIEEATKTISTCPVWTCSNILMANDQGQYKNFEFYGHNLKEVQFPNGNPVHTNHYLLKAGKDQADPLFENSLQRLRRARELDKKSLHQGPDRLAAILKDRHNESDAICAPYKDVDSFRIGTVASIIMNLPERKMQLTRGNPFQCPYESFHLQ